MSDSLNAKFDQYGLTTSPGQVKHVFDERLKAVFDLYPKDDAKKPVVRAFWFNEQIEIEPGVLRSLRRKCRKDKIPFLAVTNDGFDFQCYLTESYSDHFMTTLPNYSVSKEGPRNELELRPFSSIRELQLIVAQIADLIYAKHGHDRLRLFDDMLTLLLAKIYDETFNSSNLQLGKISRMPPERAKKEFSRLLKKALGYFMLLDMPTFLGIDSELLLSCIRVLLPYSLKMTMNLDGQAEILGTFYQQVVSSTFRGSLGAYLTPKPICDFAVRICEPKEDDTIFDVSCGTGTFLLTAHRFRFSHKKESKKAYDVFGIDIQERMVLTSIINSIFHGNVLPHILQGDGLSVDLAKWNDKDPSVPKDGFSLIVGNPPFAGYEERYDFEGQFPYSSSQRGAGTRVHKIIPFVFKVLNLLKAGGRAALVIPISVLNAEADQFKWLRKILKEKTHVTAIIGLPRDAFAHTDCGVEGALIFFTKKKIDSNSSTFVTTIRNLGYDRNGRPMPGSQIDKIASLWRSKIGSEFYNTARVYNEDRWDPKWIRYKLSTENVFSKSSYVRLTDIVTVVNRRISVKNIDPHGTYRYFELGDANMDTGIVETTHEIMGADLARKGRLRLRVKKGDILLPNHRDSLMAKSSRGVGRSVVLVGENLDGYVVSNRFIVLRSEIDPLALCAILNSRFVREQLVLHSRGSASFDIREKVLIDVWIPRKMLLKNNIERMRQMILSRLSLVDRICELERNLDLLLENASKD